MKKKTKKLLIIVNFSHNLCNPYSLHFQMLQNDHDDDTLLFSQVGMMQKVIHMNEGMNE